MTQNGYGAVGILSGLPQRPMTPLIQRNQRIEGEGREAFFIMKYFGKPLTAFQNSGKPLTAFQNSRQLLRLPKIITRTI